MPDREPSVAELRRPPSDLELVGMPAWPRGADGVTWVRARRWGVRLGPDVSTVRVVDDEIVSEPDRGFACIHGHEREYVCLPCLDEARDAWRRWTEAGYVRGERWIALECRRIGVLRA